jgi:hypothetical protein
MNTPASSGKPRQTKSTDDQKKDFSSLGDHERQRSALDLGVRRIALYGAMGLVAVMYGAGICVALGVLTALAVVMARLEVDVVAALEVGWHLVVAAMAALFSVPTVLAIAVIRSVGAIAEDPGADTMHGVISGKAMDLIEKSVGRR